MVISTKRLKPVLWYGCLFGLALGWSLMALIWSLDTGCQMDYCIYYSQANGYSQAVFLYPDWFLLMMKPLSSMPFNVSFVALALINAVLIIMSVKLLGTLYPFLLLFSIPVYHLFLTGQMDGLVMVGMALGWLAIQTKAPYILAYRYT
jgi:hypothetical protein